MTVSDILAKVRGRDGTLALSGTQVPKFERSALHCGARLAVKPINDVLAIDDPEGILWTKFAETKAGQDIIAGLKAYVLFALDNPTGSAS